MGIYRSRRLPRKCMRHPMLKSRSVINDDDIGTASVRTQEESSQERRSRLSVCSIYNGEGRIYLFANHFSVLLQAMKQEPPEDAKCRDKFLVQSVAVTSDKEFTNINEIVRSLISTSFSSS
jgi:hypothetical protein